MLNLLQHQHCLLRQRLLGLSRMKKRLLQLGVDLLLVWFALWLAFFIRLEGNWLYGPQLAYWLMFALAPLVSLPVFTRMGLYRTVMRYVNSQAIEQTIKAVSLSCLLFAVAVFFLLPKQLSLPRTVLFIYWLILMLFIGGSRWLMRRWFDPSRLGRPPKQLAITASSHPTTPTTPSRVFIYGAGAAGNQLLSALRMSREFLPLGFIDDDPSLHGRIVAGLMVYNTKSLAAIVTTINLQEVLLAVPSASRQRRSEILEELAAFKLKVRTVPGFMDLASGRVKVQDLREVGIADLLGRDSVAPHQDLLEHCIQSKVVMVTGAGGSIGSELCRQILRNQPAHLILFEHSEYALYAIHQELSQAFKHARITPILGSVRDQERLHDIMSAWQVNTVYHAAAYKHVPLVEHNIAEGVLNNIFGTLYAAQAAIQAQVENFVLVSTDKAVRPTNIMGATKRIAEMILQALTQESHVQLLGQNTHYTNITRFTMVRFGNVLGSSGSVIPVFAEQIRQGGPITVTHPEITRYFMTIPEAAQLVIQAGAMGKGGDVFVLDMGEPVRIADLARKMVQLSGLQVKDAKNPDGDISIRFTQLRPGEKLYEELLIDGNTLATDHSMIMRAQEAYIPWARLLASLEQLQVGIQNHDYLSLRSQLQGLVSGYKHEPQLVDWLHVKLSKLNTSTHVDVKHIESA